MTKKTQLLEHAHELYVRENFPQQEIAKKLGLSERTIRRWKIANGWDKERHTYLTTKTAFHEDLYEFSRKLFKKIQSDIDANKKVAPARFLTAAKMLGLIDKIKAYEDKVITTKAKEHNKPSMNEIIREIEEKVLGITYEN